MSVVLALALTAALAASGSAETDREALVALYNATDGENWENSDNWLSGAPLGEWEGVYTNDDGRVTALVLFDNALSGEIPPELGDLPNLEELHLGGNELTGEIPPELGNLPNLYQLSLNCQLSGEIPPELSNLANLQYLVLGGNQLSGEIPPELGKLANLTGLVLRGNQLSGCVPSSLSGRLDMDNSDLGGLPFCPAATAEPTPMATAEPPMAQTPPETDREGLVALSW